MTEIQTKIPKWAKSVLFFALWLTYCFRDAFTNGMDIRVLPYIYSAYLGDSLSLVGTNFVWIYYVFEGLILAAVCYLAVTVLYGWLMRSVPFLPLPKNDFCVLIFSAVTLSNVLVGAVMWCCYLNALLYSLASAVCQLLVQTPIMFAAFFYLKKHYLNETQSVRAFVALFAPYCLYWVLVLVTRLI